MLRKRYMLLMLLLSAVKAFSQTPTPQWKPLYHFSPDKNWTNDPNGLIVLNGEFQLYYQHNPFENKWGHMSWGHATSKDLLHWNHLPVAIPEVVTPDTTTYIYSGSAVWDKNNTSGFGINGKGPLVAIFTGDLPKQKKEAQYIAYSNDGGMHYTQYAHNPVIDVNKPGFRDPNVFWYEPTQQWIMTVSMVDEKKVRIYGSKNLKEWTKLSDFGPAGFTRHDWECPSLLPLMVDNDPSKIKWVMFVSSGGEHGPLIQYFVGDFDGTTFKNESPEGKVLMTDYGDAFYAAIAWRDAPQNKKIWLGWLQNGKPETYPWKGQMAIPHDLSLKTTDEGIVLMQPPSATIVKAFTKEAKAKELVKKNTVIDNTIINLSKEQPYAGNSYWIDAELSVSGAKKVGFNVAENASGSRKVIVAYDTEKQELYIDCTISESGNRSPKNLVQPAPLKAVNGIVKVQILVDGSSLEVFGNDGERVISTMIYPDTDATGISIFAEGKAEVKSAKIWSLDRK